ncbi:MAG: hypothetical protein ACUVTL_05160 [Thermoproteota archaeon]
MSKEAWLLKISSLPPEERLQHYLAVNKIMELGGSAAWILKATSCKYRGKRLMLGIGDFILKDNKDSLVSVKHECESLGLQVIKISSVERLQICELRPLTLAFYHDFGIYGESLINLVSACRSLGFSRFRFLTSSTVKEKLTGVDILFLPDGDSSVIAQGLGLGGAEAIVNFVASGGSFVAVRESGLLAASPTMTGRKIGPQGEEFQAPASLLHMLPCDVLNEFDKFPAPSSDYVFYEDDKKVRISPFDGEVIVRVTKASHPIMFGYSGRLKMCAAGPIFSAAIGSDSLCIFEMPTSKTIHHISKDLAWRIASSRPVIISGPYKAGKVIIVGAHLECPNMPSTWPILGNIIFNSISYKPPTLYEVERFPTQENAFKLADLIVHQSLVLARDVSSLKIEMEILTPKLLAVLDQAAFKAWYSSSKAMPELQRSIERLTRSTLDLALIYSRVKNLQTSIEALEGSKDTWKVSDSALDLLNRTVLELHSVLFTASRAMKVLRSIAEQISRSLTEVASLAELESTMKPDIATIRTLRCSAMTVVSAILGGAPFHSPWYDGEAGPCLNTWLVKGQEGLATPILGLSIALERLNMLLNSYINMSLS